MTVKYRIKSYEHVGSSGTALFTVEELGSLGELRVSACELLSDKSFLYGFDKKDIARIAYTAGTLNTKSMLSVRDDDCVVNEV